MTPPTITEETLVSTPPTLGAADENVDLKKWAREKGNYGVVPNIRFPELEEFEFHDRGHHADLKKASLYDDAEKIVDLTPKIGTEIHGIQLSKLTDQQKDDLALMTAERGVVFFTKQDITAKQMLDLGKHYGPLYIHNTAPFPPVKGMEPIRIIYADSNKGSEHDVGYYSNGDAWHSDMSFEKQPSGMTFLKIDTLPESGGGQTMWLSGYSAYDRLSPAMQKFVEGLEALHTDEYAVKKAKAAGRTIRREHYQTTHPVVRSHPVTKWKSLFVQPLFVKEIVGMTRRESSAVLGFLNNHIEASHDIQLRYKWDEDTVAVWDNRITAHNAMFFDSAHKGIRHGFRVISQGEKPTLDPNSSSKGDYYDVAASRGGQTRK